MGLVEGRTQPTLGRAQSARGLSRGRAAPYAANGDDLFAVALDRLGDMPEAVAGQSDLEPGHTEGGKLLDSGEMGFGIEVVAPNMSTGASGECDVDAPRVTLRHLETAM